MIVLIVVSDIEQKEGLCSKYRYELFCLLIILVLSSMKLRENDAGFVETAATLARTLL